MLLRLAVEPANPSLMAATGMSSSTVRAWSVTRSSSRAVWLNTRLVSLTYTPHATATGCAPTLAMVTISTPKPQPPQGSRALRVMTHRGRCSVAASAPWLSAGGGEGEEGEGAAACAAKECVIASPCALSRPAACQSQGKSLDRIVCILSEAVLSCAGRGNPCRDRCAALLLHPTAALQVTTTTGGSSVEYNQPIVQGVGH